MYFMSSLTQSGADTTTAATIETGITVDSKLGIQVFAFEAYWSNGEAVATADWEVNLQVNTDTGTQLPNSADNICSIMWGMQNTAGVAVASIYEPQRQLILVEPRLTVQPSIYITATTSNTAQANSFYVRVFYDTVKLSDMEVMRLLVGGA